MNTLAPLDAELAQERVLGWQSKLHRWAVEDERKRFGDLFNLLCDPADPHGRVGAGETQPGVKDRRCRWRDAQTDRAGRRGEGAGRA